MSVPYRYTDPWGDDAEPRFVRSKELLYRLEDAQRRLDDPVYERTHIMWAFLRDLAVVVAQLHDRVGMDLRPNRKDWGKGG